MNIRETQLLTAQETAEKLNISRSTLSRLVAKGVIGYYRIGLRTMFSEEHVTAYLRSVENRQSPHNTLNLCITGVGNGTV